MFYSHPSPSISVTDWPPVASCKPDSPWCRVAIGQPGPRALRQGCSRSQALEGMVTCFYTRPCAPHTPLPGRDTHKENGDSGSWRSINTPSPIYLIFLQSQRKGDPSCHFHPGPCLLLEYPLPAVPISPASAQHSQASGSLAPAKALLPSPLPLYLLLPSLLESCPPSVWPLPTARLLPPYSHPSLHLGLNPKPISRSLGTGSLPILVREPQLSHPLSRTPTPPCPLSFLPVEIPSLFPTHSSCLLCAVLSPQPQAAPLLALPKHTQPLTPHCSL